MTTELSPADAAVMHILRRVASDPSFSWHMLHTEGLRLCLEAYAARVGKPVDEVRESIESNAASVREEPEIVQLRNRVTELEQQLGELREHAGLQDDDEMLTNLVVDDWSIRENIESLCWAVECGRESLLTVENLREILGGIPAGKLM